MSIDWACAGCGVDTVNEYFMLNHDVWNAIKGERPASGDHFLCLGCVEERLGRELVPNDFLNCPCNREDMNRSTARLRERRGARAFITVEEARLRKGVPLW